jgi:hypothetical protein
MELMIESSNNEAATLCIEDLGFQYINGALEAEGFKINDGLGIWVGSTFRIPNKEWIRLPGNGGTQSASADALAILLVALFKKSLISTDASTKIVQMMEKSGTWMMVAFNKAMVATQIKFGKDGEAVGGPVTLFSDIDVCKKSSGLLYASIILNINSMAFDKIAVAVDRLF